MRRLTSLLIVPVALLSVLGFVTSAAAAPPGVVTTRLLGSNEVPGPGDPDGSGLASVLARPPQSQVCVSITYKNIGTATGAHIHRGSSTVAGPIVVDFTPLIATSAPGTVRGCVPTTSALATEIATTPSSFYVNVHTSTFTGGAIRGQLPAA